MRVRFMSFEDTSHDTEVPQLNGVGAEDLPPVIVHGERAYGIDFITKATLRPGEHFLPVYREIRALVLS